MDGWNVPAGGCPGRSSLPSHFRREFSAGPYLTGLLATGRPMQRRRSSTSHHPLSPNDSFTCRAGYKDALSRITVMSARLSATSLILIMASSQGVCSVVTTRPAHVPYAETMIRFYKTAPILRRHRSACQAVRQPGGYPKCASDRAVCSSRVLPRALARPNPPWLSVARQNIQAPVYSLLRKSLMSGFATWAWRAEVRFTVTVHRSKFASTVGCFGPIDRYREQRCDNRAFPSRTN